MNIEEERYIVATNMERFGGGFASALAVALHHADSSNILRIKQAFPELWAEYLNEKWKN